MASNSSIINRLAAIPSVEIKGTNSPYFLFRCPDPISLGLLSSAIYEAGLSWKIEVQSNDEDPRIPYYHLVPIGNGKIAGEEIDFLEEVLVDVAKTRQACKADEYTSEGIPDLELVTLGQMFKEISRRGIDYVAVWEQNGQINFNAFGSSVLLAGMMRKAEYWMLSGQDD